MVPRTFRSRIAGAATLSLGLALGGCGDSSGPSEATLDQAVSMELLSLMFEVSLGVGFGMVASVSADGAPAQLSLDTFTFDETVPCDQGGTMRVNGSVTSDINDAGTGSWDVEYTQTPNACRVATQQNGVFEMNGNPNITVAMASNSVNYEPVGDMTFEYSGGFRWNGQGQSGSCSMNVTYRFNFQTNAVRINGTMCGHNMNFSS